MRGKNSISTLLAIKFCQKKNSGKPLEGAKCHGRYECTFGRLWRLRGMGAPAGVFGGSYGGMGAPEDVFGGGMGGIGAPAGVFGGDMGSMDDMGGMGLGGFGGGYEGTSTPMGEVGGMGAPTSVYGAMGAPPGGFVASMVSPIPPSSNDANGKEAKSRDGNDYENVK
jgi:hypothetical protein